VRADVKRRATALASLSRVCEDWLRAKRFGRENGMAVSFGDLFNGFLFSSLGAPYENDAYLCRESGQVYLHSGYLGDLEEMPDDLEDGNKYIRIPHKNELGLGKRLVFAFVSERLPNEFDRVESYFRKRGAYARFKDLLERKGVLQAWYDFEHEAEGKALREWAEENSIEISDEPKS
jgi:hypothetical protein